MKDTKDIKDFSFYYVSTLWTVKFTSDSKKLIQREGGKKIILDGACDSNTYTIYVRETLPASQTIKTILHELFHCMLTPISLSAEQLDEEQVVELLAIAMFEIWPQLPKWITKYMNEYRKNMIYSLTTKIGKK